MSTVSHPRLLGQLIDVLNLSTGVSVCYCRVPGGFGPREAVVAAYAQSLGDWNTWEYEDRYGHLREYGRDVVACGDWCAFYWGAVA
jgi:hypothetical protein